MNMEISKQAEYNLLSRKNYIANKKAEGYTIVIPKLNELFIDIDSEEQWKKHEEEYVKFISMWPGTSRKIVISESGLPHRHVYITTSLEFNKGERIAFQLILGSDPTRERLSLERLKREEIHPTLFIEK